LQWTVDRQTGAITPLWVNQGGSKLPVALSSLSQDIYHLVLATVLLSFMVNTETGVILATGSNALFLADNPVGWVEFVRACLINSYRHRHAEIAL